MRDPDMPLASNPGALLLKCLDIFFVCQPEPPDRVGINADITAHLQSRGHFLKRDLALGIHHPSVRTPDASAAI